MRVVGEAASPSDAVLVATREQPDITLFDLNNSEEGHLDCLPSLFKAAKSTRVLVLTEQQDNELSQRAVRLGATGVVFKNNGSDVLIKAIQKVHTGEAWVDRFTMATLLTEMSRGDRITQPSPEAETIATLTNREREVITAVAMGLRNRQIAERLFISDVTVRHHLTSVFSKLGVSDRFELMIYAYRHRLADPPAERRS